MALTSSDSVQKQVIQFIKENLPIPGGLTDENFKIKSSGTFSVLTPSGVNRMDKMFELQDLYRDKENLQVLHQMKGSTIGRLIIYDQKVFFKPKDAQGRRSAGIENELIMVDQINEFTKDGPIDIIIKSKSAGRVLRIPNATSVQEVGRMTAGGRKSDIDIIDNKNKVYPISIKKDNAEMWGGMDANLAEMSKAKQIVDKAVIEGLITLKELPGGIFEINKNIAYSPSPQTAKDAVFGSDNPAIVTRTFSSRDFNMIDGVLHITVSKLHTNMSQINGDNTMTPTWLIMNAKARNVRGFYRGMRPIVVMPRRVARTVVRVKS